jgi:cold shock CspA family protein
MQRPLQITARDFALTPAIEAEVRRRAEALEHFYPRLTGCHVVLEGAVKHHRKGGPFKVRVDMRAPGRELSVTRQSDEDLALALREAFDAAVRVLEDYAREQRHAVKTHEAQPHGRVRALFSTEGFGFIESADGREVYFHRNSVLNDEFDRLEVGTAVRFVEEMGDKGPQASTVAIAGK